MKMSKGRLEAFSDGVIAIIITIMVLAIPLPKTLNSSDIFNFLDSIFVYFLSFVGVGTFWIQHSRAFEYVETVTRKIIWLNLLFLFLLSLLPLLTRWVLENPGAVAPALGYNIIYILINISYVLIIHFVVATSSHEAIINMKNRSRAFKSKHEKWIIWIRLMITILIILLILILLLFIPVESNRIRLVLPVVSAVLNVIYDERVKRKNKKKGELAHK